MKLVLIDDDEDFAEVISEMLKKEGCDVLVAHSVQSARELVRGEVSINAILLDVWMNRQSSLDLIDDFHKSHSHVPVVLMSGGGGPLSLDLATSIAELKGIFGFLQKPIRRERLVKLLAELKAEQSVK